MSIAVNVMRLIWSSELQHIMIYVMVYFQEQKRQTRVIQWVRQSITVKPLKTEQ